MFTRICCLCSAVFLMASCAMIQPGGGSDSSSSESTSTAQNTDVLKPRVQGLFLQAQQDMQAGRHEAAIELFTEISQSEKKLAMPHINIAISYYELKQFDKALVAINQALDKSTSSYEAFNVHGLLMRQKGDLASAKKSYERALKLDDEYIPARQNLGILCDVYLQDYACAQTHYSFLAELMPDNKQFRGWLSDVERR